MKTLIKNAHVISPGVDLKKANVVIERGRIKAVTSEPVAGPFETVVDAKGKYVVPGFIDVHLHGACGYDVCDEDRPEAIEKIAEAKLAEGCTTFLPTTLTRRSSPPRGTWPPTRGTRASRRRPASTSRVRSSTPPAAARRTPRSCGSPTSRKC